MRFVVSQIAIDSQMILLPVRPPWQSTHLEERSVFLGPGCLYHFSEFVEIHYSTCYGIDLYPLLLNIVAVILLYIENEYK